MANLDTIARLLEEEAPAPTPPTPEPPAPELVSFGVWMTDASEEPYAELPCNILVDGAAVEMTAVQSDTLGYLHIGECAPGALVVVDALASGDGTFFCTVYESQAAAIADPDDVLIGEYVTQEGSEKHPVLIASSKFSLIRINSFVIPNLLAEYTEDSAQGVELGSVYDVDGSNDIAVPGYVAAGTTVRIKDNGTRIVVSASYSVDGGEPTVLEKVEGTGFTFEMPEGVVTLTVELLQGLG